jgi:biotin synthase
MSCATHSSGGCGSHSHSHSPAAARPTTVERWTREQALALFALPLNDLLFQAHSVHRQHFDANEVQLSTLLSIKTGGCAEDCAYCPQSAKFDTGVKADKLMGEDPVVEAAKRAKESGATRFCMGAAWRSPKARDMDKLCNLISQVKALGLETCGTFGMLEGGQAKQLADAGLDYYNHNLDTSEEYYPEIITTRTYEDRLNTLAEVRAAGMNVCCGGIVGMGESQDDRAGLLVTLANMETPPESVPINLLVQVEGTALSNVEQLDKFEFVRSIAVARILMPTSYVRLSAGREEMDEALQAMCFFAGANSIFYGDMLLTTVNPQMEKDRALFARLGLKAQGTQAPASRSCAA